ncbi:MAG: C4-type zinc ribbon domain-containing protein [Bacteroidota bacterium]
MAQTEKPIVEKLRDLYRLQLVDSEISQIEVLKGELPMEVSDLEDEIQGMETRIGRLDSQVKDLQGEIGHHEANIAEAKMLIERYEGQMDHVKNNREYEALMKETEMQRLEIQLSDKKSGIARRELEAKEEVLANTRERHAGKQSELTTKQEELKSIIAKTEKEEKKLRKASDSARKNIEPRLIKAYDRIRTNYRNGLAVVTIERNSCGGCFNAAPPQQQLEVSQRKKIIACEHCGRILVDANILEDPVEETATK